MTEIDLSRAEWRKSSYSSQSGNCVEVARNLPGLVVVRDSKEAVGARLAYVIRNLAGLYEASTRLAASGQCMIGSPAGQVCWSATRRVGSRDLAGAM